MAFEDFIVECDGLLAELSAIAEPALQERVASARDRLRKERLNILVIGEFSRGKSTFINALAGEPILPSKVNPTTATINVLAGGVPRSGRIEYHDGSFRDFELPAVQANKFLDQIVTTTNVEVNRIRTVHLRVAGRLERLLVDIIDTPGVNDLDQAREEITFSYLRNADAAVLLLDAQQPLSDSERTFLKEKVFGNDVHRVLFVINKIDEVLTGGTPEDIPRILDYVRKRLGDMLGVEAPRVFAVSAKNALRARFKGEPDPGPTSFEEFEQALIAFAAEQAREGRLLAHVERLSMLVAEQHRLLDAAASALSLALDEVGRALREVEERGRQLDRARSQIETRVSQDARRLGEVISSVALSEIEGLQRAAAADIATCQNEDDVDALRTSLSQRLRTLAETVENTARREREVVRAALERDFGDYLARSEVLPLGPRGAAHDLTPVEIRTPTTGSRPKDASALVLQGTIAGFGLGYLGASLFGPVGVAAAVMGSYFIGKARKEKQAAELARQEREEMIKALNDSCQRLADRTRNLAEEISRRESEGLGHQMQERLARGMSALTSATEAIRQAQQHTHSQREAARAELLGRLKAVVTLEERVRALMERTHAATI